MPEHEGRVASPVALESLERCKLFAGLSAQQILLLQQIAHIRQYKSGQELFRLGDAAVTIFLVAQGRVALTLPLSIRGQASHVTVEELAEGSVIGWSALVPPHKLTLSARALTDLILVGLERVELEELLQGNPDLRLLLMCNLAEVIASRVSLLEALLLRDLQRWVEEQVS